MITMGSPYFVWINTNEIISSWYLLGAVCVALPYLSAQVRVHAHVLHHALRLPARAVGVVVERGLDRAGVRIKMLVGQVPGARRLKGSGVKTMQSSVGAWKISPLKTYGRRKEDAQGVGAGGGGGGRNRHPNSRGLQLPSCLLGGDAPRPRCVALPCPYSPVA